MGTPRIEPGAAGWDATSVLCRPPLFQNFRALLVCLSLKIGNMSVLKWSKDKNVPLKKTRLRTSSPTNSQHRSLKHKSTNKEISHVEVGASGFFWSVLLRLNEKLQSISHFSCVVNFFGEAGIAKSHKEPLIARLTIENLKVPVLLTL